MKKLKKPLFKLKDLNKIYHISDIHLRNFKRHDEYKRVFAKLRDYIQSTFTDDSLICLTGDIVHAKTDVTPELIQEVQALFKMLADIGPVLIIPGNHDANLNNAYRLDAITPIVNALSNENIHYIKDTCTFKIANKTFVHWSVFDKPEHYSKADTIEGEYKINLFHGCVTGTALEGAMAMIDQVVNISDFDGFDIALLGDIHKRQFLNANKTIGYPGSLIQQNHGEIIGHGILVWDLESKNAKYVEIENDTAFYTIEIDAGLYSKLPSHLPKNLYLRVKYKNTQQSQIKSIISDIKQDYNVIEASIQKIQDFTSGLESDRRLALLDIRDVQYQNTLLSEYISSKFEYDEISLKRVYEINQYLNSQLNGSEVPRNSMWIPKKFTFDNMFSYGKGNIIDFTNMDGTFGIFAPNASGKSTLLDSITYCIFDKCAKTGKAALVMNNKSDKFNCKLVFELHGIEYTIERSGSKQKLGNVKVNVDFYYIDDLGTKISMNGKDRNDTNANIRALLGTYEDFTLTTLSIQNNNTGFIDMSQSDRKDLLAQFLDINIYEDLFNLANNESKEVSILLKQYQKEDYYDLLKQVKYELETSEIKIEDLKEKKIELQLQLDTINTKILDQTKELTKIDLVTEDITELDDQSAKVNVAIKQFKDIIDLNETQIQTIKEKVKQFEDSIAHIDQKILDIELEEYKILQNKFNDINLLISKASTELDHKKEKMDKLKELKYDEKCPFCMDNVFVKDAIHTKTLIKQNQIDLDALIFQQNKFKLALKESQVYIDNKKLLDNTNKDIQILLGSKNSIDTSLNKIKIKLSDANTLLDKIKIKISEYKRQQAYIEKNKAIQHSIDLLTIDKKREQDKLTLVEKEITEALIESRLNLSKKQKYEESISAVKELECKYKDYQYYLDAVHRDGIPHNLISNTIPLIEEEINNILGQLVDFSVILRADDKAINAYIAYDEDNYWSLELTSGMEKFIASLAIRTSLINISTLPRPNFIAIDEGFGALDQANLGSMVMLFEYLKTQFKFIMIISHIDSMRDIVEHNLEIVKINGKSKLDFN